MVEDFDVSSFTEVNDGPAIWSLPFPIAQFATQVYNVKFPLAMERDYATAGQASQLLMWSKDHPIETAEDFAHRLARLRSVSMTLTWTFQRPRLFRPSRREMVRRRQVVPLDADAYRQRAIEHWQSYGEEYAHLVDIAEGREPA